MSTGATEDSIWGKVRTFIVVQVSHAVTATHNNVAWSGFHLLYYLIVDIPFLVVTTKAAVL